MKVCIVGTAPGSRLIAPYSDNSYDIWVCSAGNSQASALPRVTKWYEMHAINDMMAAENQSWCAPYFAWLRVQSFPIYMQEINEYIPQALVYPMKRMCERFGPNPKKKLSNWFTSSVAWMMAHAIDQMRPTGEFIENGDEIAIFGVDMAATEEHYSTQKAGCLRFIEIAQQLGITVRIPYESCLGKTFPLYGYAEATPFGRKLAVREREMNTYKTSLDGQIRSLELQRAFFEGGLEGVRYDMRTWAEGIEAELETGEQQQGEAVALMAHLKSRAAVLTSDFAENGQGVFVPKSMTANPPAALAAAPLPEGSTVRQESDGTKRYDMECDTGVLGDPTANKSPLTVDGDKVETPHPAATKRAKRKPNSHAEA